MDTMNNGILNGGNGYTYMRGHLGHIMRRHPDMYSDWGRAAAHCGVAPIVGELPPDLRNCVPKNRIGDAFYRFTFALNDFVQANMATLVRRATIGVYRPQSVGDVFGRTCKIYCDNYEYRGAYSAVCRVVFGGVDVEYALKIFHDSRPDERHGPMHEIPTAVAAYRAEPRDNVRTHIAWLGDVGAGWTLADWVHGNPLTEEIDEYVPERDWDANRYVMFDTNLCERRMDNIIAGRRVDFGATYQTPYGAAPYRVRKLCRCLDAAIQADDVAAFNAICAKQTGERAQSELRHAIDVLRDISMRISVNPLAGAMVQFMH